MNLTFDVYSRDRIGIILESLNVFFYVFTYYIFSLNESYIIFQHFIQVHYGVHNEQAIPFPVWKFFGTAQYCKLKVYVCK